MIKILCKNQETLVQIRSKILSVSVRISRILGNYSPEHLRLVLTLLWVSIRRETHVSSDSVCVCVCL